MRGEHRSSVEQLHTSGRYERWRSQLNHWLADVASNEMQGGSVTVRQDGPGFVATFAPNGSTADEREAAMLRGIAALSARPQIASVQRLKHDPWQLRIAVAEVSRQTFVTKGCVIFLFLAVVASILIGFYFPNNFSGLLANLAASVE